MLRFFSGAGLLLGACAMSFAAVDSTLLSLAPSGSQMVASIDVDESKSSAFGQFLLGRMASHEDGFQKLLEQTGFDPRRDLQSVLVAVVPPSGTAQGNFAVLARGSFDQSRIVEAAQKNGSRVEQFQGVELYINKDHNDRHAFAFPDAGLAVMGDIASVKQVILNRANPGSLTAGLQEQISKIGSNDAWFASVVPPSTFAPGVSPDMDKSLGKSQALQSVLRSSGGVSFGNSAQMVFNAVTRSPQDAVALTDVIRFMASMLQMQRGNNGHASLLAPALDSMKLNMAGESVQVSLQMPEPVLEQLASMQPGHIRPAPNGVDRSKPTPRR